ncbi:MAG: hypothetical protein VB042_09485 [Victivallaceae bacterium]|nr:hypothetical protein [Victivallaceae bacterium]
MQERVLYVQESVSDQLSNRLNADLTVNANDWVVSRGVSVELMITLYDGDLAKRLEAYLAARVWTLALSADLGGNSVLLRADTVEVSGDSLVATIANVNNVDLSDALGRKRLLHGYLVLRGIPLGEEVADADYRLDAVVLNAPDISTAPPSDQEIFFYTKAEADARHYLAIEASELAEAARLDAVAAKTDAEAAKTAAESARDDAQVSADDADDAEVGASAAAGASAASAADAETAKIAAESARDDAEASRVAAGNSANAAALSAAEAKTAAEKIVDAYVYGIDYDTTIATAASACQQVVLASGTTYLNVDSFNQMPAHAWKRCVMDNLSARHVNYYLHPEDSTLKADGSTADLTGGDGDVMVEIGIVYRRNDHYTDDSGHEHIVFLVSDRQFPNSAPFRFFLVGDGETARVQYISAYKAALCDADGNPLTTDETAAAAAVYAAGHLLRSVAGAKPWANFTVANARTAAAANGGQVANAAFYEFLQLMMAIEYGTFNAQEAFSVGFSYASSGIYQFVRLTGRENFGNGSGEILADATQDAAITWSASATEATKIIQCSYRGIENPFGEFFDQADGFVANAAGYYSTTNTALYSTNYAATYSWTSHAWPASGMIKTFDAETLLPLTVGGSTTSYTCDYFLAPTTITAQIIGRASTMAYSQSGGPGMISLYTTVGNSGAPYSARLAC